jgi:hypothetical protein
MPRFIALWEVDPTKIPTSPKERGAGWAALMKMVRQDHKKDLVKSWGAFIGEEKGYAIYEGSELEVMKALQQYVPFVRFQVHAISSEDQVNELIKALTG